MGHFIRSQKLIKVEPIKILQLNISKQNLKDHNNDKFS